MRERANRRVSNGAKPGLGRAMGWVLSAGLAAAPGGAAALGISGAALWAGTASAQVLEPERGTPPGARPAASIEIESTVLDVGTMFDTDSSVTRTVRFRNTGTAPLEILNVSASCGCTAGKPDKQVYQPGESGQFEITFNPRGRTGQQRTSVTIRSNDPQRPVQTINVVAYVNRQWIIEPALLNFQRIPKGQGGSQVVTITGRGEGFFIDRMLLADNSPFSAQMLGTEIVEIGGEIMTRVSIEVTLDKNVKIGQHNDRLRLRTSETDKPEIEVALVSSVLGELVASPERVTLRGAQAGRPFTSQFRLMHRGREDFRLLDASVTVNGVFEEEPTVVVQAAPEGGYRIILNGVAPETERFIRGEVILKTNVEGEEEIRVTFLGNVMPRR